MNATLDLSAKAAAKRAQLMDAAKRSGKDWRKTVGWAEGDPLHAEAVRLGAEYRKVENSDAGDARP